jgi:hypothetical protein
MLLVQEGSLSAYLPAADGAASALKSAREMSTQEAKEKKLKSRITFMMK